MQGLKNEQDIIDEHHLRMRQLDEKRLALSKRESELGSRQDAVCTFRRVFYEHIDALCGLRKYPSEIQHSKEVFEERKRLAILSKSVETQVRFVEQQNQAEYEKLQLDKKKFQLEGNFEVEAYRVRLRKFREGNSI